MKFHKDTFNIYLKIVKYLFIKFTINIILFSLFSLAIIKIKKNIFLIITGVFVYLMLWFIINRIFNKKILSDSLNIKKSESFLYRKKILISVFSEKFNVKEYYKNNLILLLLGLISFFILLLASIPLAIMVKDTYYIMIIMTFALVFTIFFVSNIISPLILINEYKNMEGT